MLFQRKVTVKSYSGYLSHAEMGEVIVNSSSDTDIDTPYPPLAGLWYHISNIGEGISSITAYSDSYELRQGESLFLFGKSDMSGFYGIKTISFITKDDIEEILTGEISTHTHDYAPTPIISIDEPTEQMVGIVGQLYIETATPTIYYLSAIEGENYIWNQLSGGSGGGFVMNPNHIFTNNQARDDYFVLHPEELVTGILVSVGEGFHQWDGTLWVSKTAILTGPPGPIGETGPEGPEGPVGPQGEAPITYEILPELVMSASHIVSSSSITIPSHEWSAGDYLILCVMHRSTLTVPDGWTLLSTVGPHPSDSGNNQANSILYRIADTDGSGTLVVQQASYARIAACVLVIRGITSLDIREDYEQSLYEDSATIIVPAKDNNKLWLYAMSRVVWASDTSVWASSPGLPAIPWQTATSSNSARLGVFLDNHVPAQHIFTAQGGDATSGKFLAVLEMTGTIAPFKGEQGEQGQQGPTGLGVPVIWKDNWSGEVEYDQQDGVHYEGASYVSKQDGNLNHLPTDSVWWHLIADKGEQGDIGPIGETGPEGPEGPLGPVGPEQPRPTDIQYYSDGFIVIFADETTGNYSWIRDGQGRITNITRMDADPNQIMTVGYNSGPRP